MFFLGVLNYKHLDDDRIEHRYWLREGTTGETMTDKLKFVFVEVAKFNKTEDELTTDLDKWLYMLKNLSDLLERPAALRDKIFKRIFDIAEISSLDDEDKKNTSSICRRQGTHITNWSTRRKRVVRKGAEKSL